MNGRNLTMDEHIGERAELYALGALEPDDVAAIDAHAARCVACTRLLGNAERTVTAFDAIALPSHAPPPSLDARIAAIATAPVERASPFVRAAVPFSRWAATAAAVVILVGGLAATREIVSERAIVAQDDVALGYVARAHFNHATLTKLVPGAPLAKALWGRGRTWTYVVIDAPQCACRVVAITATGERDLGAPLRHAQTSAVFAAGLPPVVALELRNGPTTLARTAVR